MDMKTLLDAGRVVPALDRLGNPLDALNPYAVRGANMIQTKHGTILVFSSFKFESQADEAVSTCCILRSEDEGTSWETLRSLPEGGVPVYDEQEDKLLLFIRHQVWKPGMEENHLLNETDVLDFKANTTFAAVESIDDGRTWSQPYEVALHMSDESAAQNWSKIFSCPSTGIQLKQQKDTALNSRLVIPSNHATKENGRNCFRSHLIYSDDHGMNWKVGALQPIIGSNESQAVEMSDGTLIHNCRDQNGLGHRIEGRSADGGQTFSETGYVDDLYDPVCHAGFNLAVSKGREYLMFTAPTGPMSRKNMFGIQSYWGERFGLSLYISGDAGRHYRRTRMIDPGFAAYSAILSTASGKTIILWESGPKMNRYMHLKYMVLDTGELIEEYEAKRSGGMTE